MIFLLANSVILILVFWIAFLKQLNTNNQIVRWNALDVSKIIAIFILIKILIALILIYSKDLLSMFIINDMVVIYEPLISHLILLQLVLFIIINKNKVSTKDIGFQMQYVKPSLIIKLVVVFFIIRMIALFYNNSSSSVYPREWLARVNSSTFLLTVSFLSIVIIVPFIEELFYRGVMYSAFKNKMNSVLAMLSSSLIWALFHNSQIGLMFGSFIFGIILSIIFEKTRSIIPCIIIHSINNAFFYLFVFSPFRN